VDPASFSKQQECAERDLGLLSCSALHHKEYGLKEVSLVFQLRNIT